MDMIKGAKILTERMKPGRDLKDTPFWGLNYMCRNDEPLPEGELPIYGYLGLEPPQREEFT